MRRLWVVGVGVLTTLVLPVTVNIATDTRPSRDTFPSS